MAKVTVVTACTGSISALRAAKSVSEQTLGDHVHLLVVDGPEFAARFDSDVRPQISNKNPRQKLLYLPWNTGHSSFFGYRIYAMASAIVDTPWIAFLDQDNYYQPDHLESLVSLCEKHEVGWAFSQRRIADLTSGKTIEDNCESLGPEVCWNVQVMARNEGIQVDRPWSNLVDMNSYLIRKEVAASVGSSLVRYDLPLDRRKAMDRVLFEALRQTGLPYMCSGQSTTVWPINDPAEKAEVGGTSGEHWMGNRDARIEFFQVGNTFMVKKYGERLPWKTRQVFSG